MEMHPELDVVEPPPGTDQNSASYRIWKAVIEKQKQGEAHANPVTKEDKP